MKIAYVLTLFMVTRKLSDDKSYVKVKNGVCIGQKKCQMLVNIDITFSSVSLVLFSSHGEKE